MRRGTRIALLSMIAAMFAAAAGLVLTSPTPYRVGLSSIVQLWGDVTRDADAVTKTLSRVSTAREIEIGDEIDRGIWLSAADDPALQAYVDVVGQRIAAKARRRDIPYRFRVVNSSEINAFAIAGGHVYVTSAMIKMLDNEAELAAILGHEIAHIDLRHCIERLQIEIAMRRAGLGDLAAVLGIVEDLVQLGYSETMEREADRLGMLLAAEAGYSPLSALDIFRRMYFELEVQGEEDTRTRGPEGELARALYDALDEYFATHPPALERLDALRALLQDNARAWEGERFVIGTAAYRDRRPAGAGEGEGEGWIFSARAFEYLAMRAEIAGLLGREQEAQRFFHDLEAAFPGDPRIPEVEERMTAKTLPASLRREPAPEPETGATGARAAYDKGRALERANDYEGALEAFREAVRLDPDLALAHAHMGEVAYFLEDDTLALSAFQEAVRLDPAYDWAWAHMSRPAFRSGDFRLALSSLEQALRIDPDYEWAHARLGRMAMDLGLHALAIEHLETVIRLDDAGSDTERNNLAWVLVSAELGEFRDPEKALPLAVRAAGTKDDWASLDTLGAVQTRLGDVEAALSAYGLALEQSPDKGASLAKDLVFLGCADAMPEEITIDSLRPALLRCIGANTPPHVLANSIARIERLSSFDPTEARRLLAGLEQDYPEHEAVSALREKAATWGE